MNILKYCGYAILITLTMLIIYILWIAVVYAVKKAINEENRGK